MIYEEEPCVRCGGTITDDGIIYIREKVNKRWGSHPICSPCWYKEKPDRIPHRCFWSELEE